MIDGHLSLTIFLKKLSNALCFVVMGIGLLLLLAWGMHLVISEEASYNAISFNPQTSICFILASVSIYFFNRTRDSKWGKALGAVVALTALIEIVKYVWECFNANPHPKIPVVPLSPNTWFNLFLIGCALMVLDNQANRQYRTSEFLLLAAVLTSFFAVMGYTYNVASFSVTQPIHVSMSFTTAMSFIVLCIAAYCSRPDFGLMKTLSGDGFGSVTIRRLLPVSIFLPTVLSVLSLQGKGAGLYGPELGVAIYTIGVIIIFAMVIWFNAQLLNGMDVDRKMAEEKIQQATKAKSEFTSMVSHELRTPLTVIKESVAIVYDGTAGEINADQKDFLETAKRNVDRLGRLINSVLDYQKLETQHVEMKMVEQDINKVIAETGRSFELPIKNKGLELRLHLAPDLPRLTFDADKIIQVLINLLNNAMKFTEKGAVTISSERMGENAVKVSVADQGIGIKEEDMGKLFQSFSQISTGTGRITGGTGLGLVISKKIVENHKGQMKVSSVFGRGTTFYFILPIKDRRV
jgi:signal transduction histidine kinase